MTEVHAAVARTVGAPLEFAQLSLDELRPDEVRVRMVATGVCHTDALVRDGVLPGAFPLVLGHEGAGVVEAIGRDVTTVAVGDHVVLGFTSCGSCAQCNDAHPAYCETFPPLNFGGQRPDGSTALTESGARVSSHFFGQSSFASVANVSERSVARVPKEAPLEILGPLGCGITTGAGTVLNVLRPGPGSSILILGAGAVGDAALLAAVVAGCTTIIVVDVVPHRLEFASSLGATHVIDARDGDVAAAVREITGGRCAQFAIDTTGVPAGFRSMVDSLAPQGFGALVGAAAAGTEASIDIGSFLVNSPTITAVIEGDAVPQELIPHLVELYLAGRFPFDRLIRLYPFAELNAAFADSESGATIKPVVTF